MPDFHLCYDNMAMAKFPDPTKQYAGQPIDKPIDANELDTKQYKAPEPPKPKPSPVFPGSPTPLSPPNTPPLSPLGTLPPTGDSISPPTDKPKSSPFKNIIPLILGLVVFAAIVYAVVKFVLPMLGDKEPDPVTLTYWGLWEPNSIMQTVIADYERQNPYVKINYTMQSPKNYRTRLQTAIESGEGPDIARIHNTWLPMLGTSLAPAPATVISSAELNAFYPIVKNDLSTDRGVYALPTMLDGLVLFYNPQYLTQAGVNPPTDWNELRKLAFQLTVRNAETGVIERAGAAVGTASNIEHWSDILGLLILQNSGNPGDPSTDAVKDALTFYTIFSTQDKVWDETQPNSIYAFATGSVAMIIAPSWQAQEIAAINPDFEFGAAPAPILAGEKLGWATFWAEAVPKTSKNSEEAWKFIKFLTGKDSLQKLYAAQVSERGYGEPYPLKELANLLQEEPVSYSVVSQGDSYESWFMSSRTFDEGINDQIIKYYEDAINAINGGASVAGQIKTLTAGVEQILSRYPSAK